MRTVVVLVICSLISSASWAQSKNSKSQDSSPGEVFFGYSFLNGETLSKASGWDASAMANVHDWLGVKADFSGHYKSAGPFHDHEYNILFGPQVSDHIDRLTAFAHGLIGVAHFGSDVGATSTSAGWVLGGGLDYDWTHNFAIRFAQLDYHGGHVFDQTQRDFRFSAGLVYKFK